jgi:predicted O-methyltransferase YrrM
MTVLEIGVYKGASLRMWRDYFRQGSVVGIDKNPAAEAHADERIRIHVGSQADGEFLDSVAEAAGPFDLIVDDGAHRFEPQMESLAHLWPHLNPNGIYVIEDTHTSYLEKYEMGWREPRTTIEAMKGVADDLHGRFHDHPVEYPGVKSLHFFPKLCVMCRAG